MLALSGRLLMVVAFMDSAHCAVAASPDQNCAQDKVESIEHEEGSKLLIQKENKEAKHGRANEPEKGYMECGAQSQNQVECFHCVASHVSGSSTDCRHQLPEEFGFCLFGLAKSADREEKGSGKRGSGKQGMDDFLEGILEACNHQRNTNREAWKLW